MSGHLQANSIFTATEPIDRVMRIGIGISEEVLRRFDLSLAYNIVQGVKVKRDEIATKALLSSVMEKIKGKYSLDNLRDDPVVRAYRDFYWRIGIDPTKQRPSSEAMLRRALRRGSIPVINNVVDAGNVASMEALVPIGLYDLDLVRGNLKLRFAREGEEFDPIGGEKEELRGNQIVLSDEEGVVHVFPHRDSRRTMIRNSTTKVLVVACGVPGVDKAIVRRACDKAVNYITKLAGGSKIYNDAAIVPRP